MPLNPLNCSMACRYPLLFQLRFGAVQLRWGTEVRSHDVADPSEAKSYPVGKVVVLLVASFSISRRDAFHLYDDLFLRPAVAPLRPTTIIVWEGKLHGQAINGFVRLYHF